jgi:hypothetical protein
LLGNPIFGGAKLMWQLLRHIQRMSAICFGDTGRLVQQLQYGLASGIKLIAVVWCCASCSRTKSDYGLGTSLISHLICQRGYTTPIYYWLKPFLAVVRLMR